MVSALPVAGSSLTWFYVSVCSNNSVTSTVHNRIGLYLWKQDSIREFQTLFVMHMDFICENLDKMEGVSV